MKQNTLKKKINIKEMLFYLSLVVYPIVHFIIFYVIVNANSLVLSFKNYEYISQTVGGTTNITLKETFVGLQNIIDAYKFFFNEKFIHVLWNSLMFYGVSLLGGTVCSLLFSYYIFKKCFGGEFLKVMLFLPSVVSGMTIAIMFRFFAQYSYPEVMEKIFELKVTPFSSKIETQRAFLVLFNLIFSFGANMLIYTGTMAGISDSVLEAAEIDGANSWQEFVHVVLPGVYPTMSLFVVVGILSVFTGQASLFNFYGTDAPNELWTYGYYLFVQSNSIAQSTDYTAYPLLAAKGLSLTFIVIPVMFTGKWLVKKFGPSDE